jgi:AcrR family transcriptional regulator
VDYTHLVRGWVPVPGSTKGRLITGALAEFGARGYAAVSVTELAELADVTIGSLYHHFGSKLGIYTTVRVDVERRLLDRMEGAAAMRSGRDRADLGAVLLVGFDYLVKAGFARLLAEPHPEPDPERGDDPIEAFVASLADRDAMPIGRILLAAWRAALGAAAECADPAPVRAALREVLG